MLIEMTLEAKHYPDGPDPFQRLRRLLKALLRVYGLKCVSIRRKESDE
ncbi:hypothetical protein SH467x_001243 [Pirellulaceae bacterium SH467]